MQGGDLDTRFVIGIDRSAVVVEGEGTVADLAHLALAVPCSTKLKASSLIIDRVAGANEPDIARGDRATSASTGERSGAR